MQYLILVLQEWRTVLCLQPFEAQPAISSNFLLKWNIRVVIHSCGAVATNQNRVHVIKLATVGCVVILHGGSQVCNGDLEAQLMDHDLLEMALMQCVQHIIAHRHRYALPLERI